MHDDLYAIARMKRDNGYSFVLSTGLLKVYGWKCGFKHSRCKRGIMGYICALNVMGLLSAYRLDIAIKPGERQG